MNNINCNNKKYFDDKDLKEYLIKKWKKNEQLYEVLCEFEIKNENKIYKVEKIRYPNYKTTIYTLKAVKKIF